ncbi:ROK family transcriptional regulator [Kibdelosporangium lantanae]
MASTSRTNYDARELLWTPSDSLKDANRRKIIRAVMLDPNSTQVNIARITRLSQATVSTVVGELQEEKVFRVDSGGGERGKRVRLGNVRGLAVGIEVNHTGLTVAARRVDTAAMVSDSVGFSADQGARIWVLESVRLIKELARKTGLDEDHIVSIGLGVPAAVDPRTALVTQVASTLEWNLGGDPRKRFNEHFPNVPIIVDNEANLAAYGEYVFGAGKGDSGRNVETMLFVKASTGIGSGLIIGGLIYRGRHGLAGELGHLTVDPTGTVCRCGSRGCLETLIGGARLVEQVRQAYSGYRIDLPTSLESMIERAKAGDRVCERVLYDAGRNMGLALARVCNLVNPEIIVLGGELGRASDLLVRPAEDVLRLYALKGMFEHQEPTRIVDSQLGLLAGAQGALGFALKADMTVAA